MRGNKIIKILNILRGCALSSKDLFEALLSAGYGASAGRVEYLMSESSRRRQKNKELFETFVKERQRFNSFIYYLKNDGIISEVNNNGKNLYSITAKGKKKLAVLLKLKNNTIPVRQYPKVDNKTFTIVTFDIPEKEKKKREWFRSVLLRLGYKIIQRSVLLGKTKIPQSLLDDLRRLKMIDYIEIFEITKTGSLRHLL